jgi:hypothetical protein
MVPKAISYKTNASKSMQSERQIIPCEPYSEASKQKERRQSLTLGQYV